MKNNNLFLIPELPDNPAEKFRELGEKYASAWRNVGVKTTFSRTPDLNHFRKASEKTQLSALSYLEFNLAIVEEMNHSGESLLNTKRFVWRAMKKLNFIFPVETMELIDDDDVVEIYTMSEMQVFRNSKCLETLSISIEDILTLPWYQITKRSWKALLAISRTIVPFKLGFVKDVVKWNVPEHVVQEINGAENFALTMLLKYFVPLKQDGRIVATLSTNQSRVISRTPRGD